MTPVCYVQLLGIPDKYVCYALYYPAAISGPSISSHVLCVCACMCVCVYVSVCACVTVTENLVITWFKDHGICKSRINYSIAYQNCKTKGIVHST